MPFRKICDSLFLDRSQARVYECFLHIFMISPSRYTYSLHSLLRETQSQTGEVGQASDSNASPSKTTNVAGSSRTAPPVAGGTDGCGVPVVAVKIEGSDDTVVLPPGYGGAEEIGDKLDALLKQELQVTVSQVVLYVVEVSGPVETAATEELLGVMNIVDLKVVVIVEVV
jgi:hypothetical protein